MKTHKQNDYLDHNTCSDFKSIEFDYHNISLISNVVSNSTSMPTAQGDEDQILTND